MRDLNNNSITREAQLQNREVLWGSSVDQTDEPMNKNVIGGTDGGRAGPGSRSPSGQTRCVNDAVVSGKCINLSGETSTGGLTGLESAHSKLSVSASNGGDRADRGVSKRHISRGNEHGVAADGSPVQRRVMMDSRSGEGLQYVWQLDLPLEPTHKRRPAREFMGRGQNSRLQTEFDFSIKQPWWNVKFLRITALKQTA